METRIPIEELVAKVIAELKRLKYASQSLQNYRRLCKHVISFACARNERYFSEALGAEFLKEKHGCRINIYTESMPKHLRNRIRMLRVLGDFQLHGVVFRRVVKKPKPVKPPQFEEVLSAYEAECLRLDYSRRGLRSRINRLFSFIYFLDSKGVQGVNEIAPALLSDYIRTIYVHHEKSMSSILTAIRTFLKFLYLGGYTEKDFSNELPKIKKYYCPAIPSVWNTDDVKRMLKCIDRGNPAGKRDYAILLLAAKLGMRVGDIKALKLHDLNWNGKTIAMHQSKTGHHVTYPILDDVGWALIDYLRNGRPETDSQFIFVRLNAPHEAFGENANLHNIITKYTRLAGIKIPREARHGLHSLRHTLASTLLEQGTPLPVISSILGHLNSKSTSIYLKVNIDGLRQCALDPEEVFTYER